MRLGFLLLVLLPLAGCVDPSGDTWQARGTFTEEPRPDWEAWAALVADYTDQPAAIMESYPEQFLVTGMTKPDCEAFVAEARALAYVRSVRDCERGPATR